MHFRLDAKNRPRERPLHVGPDAFATTILENLRKAGVQNTIKGERLKFDSLDPFAGEWIHAQGTREPSP